MNTQRDIKPTINDIQMHRMLRELVVVLTNQDQVAA